MKRNLYTICVICLLLTLIGCGRQRVSGSAEDLPYPVTWQEKRENIYWVTIRGEAPDGYVWTCEGSGIVSTKGPTEKRKGTVFSVSAEDVGKGEVVFSLISTDGLEHTCYTFTMNFLRMPDSKLEVMDYSYFEAGALEALGDERYPVYAAQTEDGLQLSIDGMWTYTHENEHLVVDGGMDGGKLTLLIHRMSSSQIASEVYEKSLTMTAEQTEDGTETDEAAEAPSLGEMEQAYYDAQSDVLTLTSRDISLCYELTLQMDKDGTVTVKACEQLPILDETQIEFEEITEEEFEAWRKELNAEYEEQEQLEQQRKESAGQLEEMLTEQQKAELEALRAGGTNNEN